MYDGCPSIHHSINDLQGTIQASKKKDKKSKKIRAVADDEIDGDASTLQTTLDTSAKLEDEWPEEEIKPKRGKKGKKEKKMEEEVVDEDMNDSAEPNLPVEVGVPLQPADTAVNIEDEWPEEDVKPKKGKKGKKGKKTVEEEENDLPNEVVIEKVSIEEKAEESPKPAPRSEEVKPPAEDAEEDDGELEDGAPKVKISQ